MHNTKVAEEKGITVQQCISREELLAVQISNEKKSVQMLLQ
jgi:hypothetical protein